MPRNRSASESSTSSRGFRQRDWYEDPKMGEDQGAIDADPRFKVCGHLSYLQGSQQLLTSSQHREDMEEEHHENTLEGLTGKKTGHHGTSHSKRAPTAHKGSSAGGSAAKRVGQTAKREKAMGKHHEHHEHHEHHGH